MLGRVQDVLGLAGMTVLVAHWVFSCLLALAFREILDTHSGEICNCGLKTSENSKLSYIDFIKSPNESHGKTVFGIILLSDKMCFLGRMVNHL